jgi:HNH endonuclease
MKLIPLSGGKGFAQVDDEDYEFLSQFKWTLTAKGYAMAGVRMHRLVMKAPDGVEVDHRFGDRLDNRKESLRLCTSHQNSQSKKKYKGAKSGLKGVISQTKPPHHFQAKICYKNKPYHLGTFGDKSISALMYDFWATYLYGEFAMTNFHVVSQWTNPNA